MGGEERRAEGSENQTGSIKHMHWGNEAREKNDR
jgi:hypothetical protein